jgi:predicted dehydrogenase
MVTVIGGGEPVVPLADFADAYKVQRVLSAVVESDKQRSPVPMSAIQ